MGHWLSLEEIVRHRIHRIRLCEQSAPLLVRLYIWPLGHRRAILITASKVLRKPCWEEPSLSVWLTWLLFLFVNKFPSRYYHLLPSHLRHFIERGLQRDHITLKLSIRINQLLVLILIWTFPLLLEVESVYFHPSVSLAPILKSLWVNRRHWGSKMVIVYWQQSDIHYESV